MSSHTESNEQFSTRLGLILSVIGIAIGTGNFWRFPRIAAQNSGEDGSGAFLVTWLVFLLLWSIPLIIAEYAIGRNGRKGTIGSIMAVAGEKYAWLGAFVGCVATAIMFYYSVVTGWCFYYFGVTASGGLPADANASIQLWDAFQSSYWPVWLHAIAIFGGAYVVWKGVKWIERISLVLLPGLFMMVLVILGWALSQEGSMQGLSYLFTPDWSTLSNPSIWLEALTQNAWDTGAGWGLILTYAAYMKKSESVTQNALITGIGNNTMSLVAAMIIFSTVFAALSPTMSNAEILEVMKTSGPASTGLTFIWIPQLFSSMPNGTLLAAFFFLGLSFAAFTSLLSMIALTNRILTDMGYNRSRVAYGVAIIGFLLGMPSAINLNIFANQDFVWGLALMISGAIIAFSVIKYGKTKFREELINTSSNDLKLGKWWETVIGVLVPLQVVILLGWWIWRSATEFAPETWYNPFDPYSVATCVVQWSILATLLWSINRTLIWRTEGK
jgi:NSS family neurotransmitter:Na+ symporter